MRKSATSDAPTAATIGAVVLAGGRARRFGGQDKGLIRLQGRPLAAWVIDRLRPQVDAIVLSANRHFAEYGALGCPVVRDAIPGHAGPLAGIHATITVMGNEWVLTSPCDTPFLPLDLASRLLDAALGQGRQAVYAAEPQQPHYGIMLFNRALSDHLDAYLRAGGHKVETWLQAVDAVPVVWPACTEAFFNINTPDDLARAEALAARLVAEP